MDRKLPWDFVPTTDTPGPGLVPNAPCEVGAEFGAELARFCDQEYATTGRDARCLDCAFRKGTLPNQTAATPPPKIAIDGPIGGVSPFTPMLSPLVSAGHFENGTETPAQNARSAADRGGARKDAKNAPPTRARDSGRWRVHRH